MKKTTQTLLLSSLLFLCSSLRASNYYWVGGTGTWSDFAAHWATTSGGTVFHVTIPSPGDDVFFDANSFLTMGDTVYMDTTITNCHNMDWSGAQNIPVLSSASLKIFGSLTLISAMTCSPQCSFESTNTGNTITTAGHTIGASFRGTGGGWTLLDTLNTNAFTITAGSFYSNNQVINCSYDFSASGPVPQAVHLGTSVFNVGGTNWQANNSTALVMDAGSATINMNTTGGAIFYGGSYTYHEVNFPYTGFIYGNNNFGKVMVNSTMTLFGSNTFDTLLFNNPGKVITLGSGETQTIIDTLIADGTCTGLTVLKSYTASQQATISKANGSITLSYLLMQDINATGGATFTANNSVVISNVTGWTVPTATIQNLYWVGGSGNWNDPNHWATVSGGAGGSCVPSPYDDVYFDVNSFTGVNDTVLFNVTTGYCHNMDWTGAANSPLFTNASLKIFGSLTLISAMTCSPQCSFESTNTGNTITTAGHTIGASFRGTGGGWTLLDTLNTNAFTITAGSFYSNNQVINCSYDFSASGPVPQAVHLGTSVFNVGGTNWQANNSTALVMDAGNATINMNTTGGAIFYGGSYTYHEVNFPYTGFIYGNNNFGKVMVNSTMTLFGSNTFDTLLLINPGQILTLQDATTNSVNGLLFVQSDPGFPTSVKCAAGNTTILQSTGNVCMDYVYLQNISATGGAGFFAGDHSVDLGGNTGWSWVRCAPLISNVWPGDCNYDLVTDNFDLLNIGVSYGDTGYVRPGASLSYVAQPCQDWYYQFINAANVKHADCDGNGVVDANDSTAITLNYGLTHPARLVHQDESNTSGAPLEFVLPPVIVPGSTVSVPITLGTSVVQANGIYGIAFTVDYDPAFIQAGTMSVDYSGSWVESAGNHLHLEKDFPGAGKTDLAFTRIDHSDVSGYGIIATLNFTVSPTADGTFNLSFSHVRVISHNEIDIPVQTGTSTTYVNVKEAGNEIASSVYPNPMSDRAQIIFSNPNHDSWFFSMKDVTGRIVSSERIISGNIVLVEKKNLRSGVYFYTLKNAEGKTGKGKLIVE